MKTRINGKIEGVESGSARCGTMGDYRRSSGVLENVSVLVEKPVNTYNQERDAYPDTSFVSKVFAKVPHDISGMG